MNYELSTMNYPTMNQDLLLSLLESLKTDVINSLQAAGSDTTGQTAKQITVVQQDGSIQLQLPGYMQLLESGRKPTSKDAVQGNPPMIQRIREWCQAKGISDKAVWAIKKSIDKKGFKGKPGILSQPLGDDNINSKLNLVLEEIADAMVSEVNRSIAGTSK
jgi:hypothetical protein